MPDVLRGAVHNGAICAILHFVPFCSVYTVTRKTQERLCNVKLKDIDAFAKKHMSINRVTVRTKQLKNAG